MTTTTSKCDCECLMLDVEEGNDTDHHISYSLGRMSGYI